MPGSENSDPRPGLKYAEFMRATAQGNAKALQELITDAQSSGQLDENLLRIALQNAAKRGGEAAVRVLLENGAKTDTTGKKGSPALFWAVSQPQTKGHIAVINMLLDSRYQGCPAKMEWRDDKGRTILMSAAMRGHKEALGILFRHGANVNARDQDGRTILHNLAADTDKKGDGDKKASDKKMKWDREVVSMILDQPIDLDIKDRPPKTRSPLHWAAATGKRDLVEQFLTRSKHRRPDINLTTTRGKTALHLACDATPADPAIVKLLLQHGADATHTSDGGFTCLHNSASVQNSVEVVKLLVEHAPSLINAATSPGLTALHFAAQAGFLEVVQYLLSLPETKLNPKDTFYSTPLIRAAQFGHLGVVDRLAPFNNTDRLSHYAVMACNAFSATIVDFRTTSRQESFDDNLTYDERREALDKRIVVDKRSVFETVYGREHVDGKWEHSVPTLVEHIKTRAKSGAKSGNRQGEKETRPQFRWIHLPANNLAWVEALIAKSFIEQGAADFDGFRAVEKNFSQQHRGPKVHSHFMRPFCKSSARGAETGDKLHTYTAMDTALKESASHIHGRKADITSSPERTGRQRFPNHVRGGHAGIHLGRHEDFPTLTEQAEGEQLTPVASGFTDITGGRYAESPGRHTPRDGEGNSPQDTGDSGGKRSRANRRRRKPGPVAGDRMGIGDLEDRKPVQPPSRKTSLAISDQSGPSGASKTVVGNTKNSEPHNGVNVTLFMPYLHFETDEGRRQMREAIINAEALADSSATLPNLVPRSDDETLIYAHLNSITGLHTRRTLDQFYLHGIDTEHRDTDQVVYRYCRDKGKEKKIFMVDQLWMWVLGPGLIITSFPQRWKQPKNDPLNVLDGIIEDLHSKTGNRIQSVYDLALLITARCSGPFDRHRPGDEEYQFLDMFESSIGNVNDEETTLYKQFYDASELVNTWLSGEKLSEKRFPQFSKYHQKTHDQYPDVVDNFINIGKETKLLQEIKDIREELNMIYRVLNQQRSTLTDLSEAVGEDLKKASKFAKSREFNRKIDEQKKVVAVQISELDRMSSLTRSTEESLLNLLDLKQKQSNALEARFARDQAAGTVRQGQIIMVFTMVTIIFLPLSFMAAFFAINIKEFPHDANGNQELGLDYVIKYTVGIGLGISVLLIAVAFSLNWLGAMAQNARSFYHAKIQARQAKAHAESTTRNSSRAAIYGLADAHATGRKSVETEKSFAADLPLSRRHTGHSDVSRRVRYSNDLEIGRIS